MIYYNNGLGVFTKTTVAPGVITEYYELAVKDIDNDGFKDIITGGTKTWVYKNTNGVFSFDTLRSNSIVNTGLVFLTELNDFDGDGDNDLMISGNNLSDIRWYANNGSGFSSLSQIFQTNITQCFSLASEDLDGDGVIDVFMGFPQTGKVVWYENTGSGSFGAEKLIFTGSIPFTTRFTTAEINNDGKPDIIWGEDLSFHLNSTSIGLKENDAFEDFRIYPNPATQTLQINALTKSHLNIYSTTGQLVKSYEVLPGKTSIEIDLEPSVYILVFSTKNTVVSKNLMVK